MRRSMAVSPPVALVICFALWVAAPTASRGDEMSPGERVENLRVGPLLIKVVSEDAPAPVRPDRAESDDQPSLLLVLPPPPLGYTPEEMPEDTPLDQEAGKPSQEVELADLTSEVPPKDAQTPGSENSEGQTRGNEEDGQSGGEDLESRLSPEGEDTPDTEGSPKTEAPPGSEPPVEVKPELSPQMAALRDRVRGTLAANSRMSFSTRANTPGEILHLCLAYGCNTAIKDARGKPISGIGCLCWNYPCAGYTMLTSGQGRIVPRVGYGFQEHPAQFLAMLAQSAVPADYEIRAGEHRASVADLAEQEKRTCRRGTDLSLKLIGLAYYADHSETWENDLGEEWSVERLVEEELARTVAPGGCEVVQRLMGLSYVVDRRRRREMPLEGRFQDAEAIVSKYHDYVLGLQNPDGSWHPGFLAYRGTSRDTDGVLRSTGYLLEWLVFSLPEDGLEDPRVVRSVDYLNNLLSSWARRRRVDSMSSRQIAGMAHALRALGLYDRRFFRPRDPAVPTPQEPAPKEASKVARRTRGR